MKKRDLYLIIALLVVGAGAFLFQKLTAKEGEQVVITVDGKLYQQLPLHETKELVIETKNHGVNKVKIQDGVVKMTEATCPDQICVKHSAIHKTGEMIVCLPNEVVVEIKSQIGEEEIDSVVQ